VSLAVGGGDVAVAAGAGGLAAASGHGASLAAGQLGSRSAVPWRRVGAGWVLAEYWPGQFAFQGTPVAAAAALYLIDPAGGWYRLYRWPVTKSAPYLVDWSGDKSRALVSSTTGQGLEQVVLATGKVSRVRLPSAVQVIGYTRPAGQGLLGWRRAGSRFQLARYRLTGRLARVLAVGADDFTAVYSPAGATLAVAGATGVQLVSNDGGVIRVLPVPGTGAGGCFPSRWWNSATILASCWARGTSRGRLWLVPASGARPAPLTPQRGTRSLDPGDIGARRLPGGLYLQALSPSGSGLIFRQAASGTALPVSVPGTAGNNWIVTSRGPRLLLSAQTPCYDSGSLLWFNPSTRHEQMLLKTPRGLAGVLGAVPYGQPVADIHIAVGCVASGLSSRTAAAPGDLRRAEPGPGPGAADPRP
jgi:hypothetical protein